jgi:two-component sensor histidine kinase
VRDDAGTVIRWMGTCTDIEDRKRIEAELADAVAAKEVLLQEVNHRVKNSLQLVTALLQLQAAQARDPQLREALGEAQARLSVVASLHQRLYSTSQHDRVDFGEYLRDLAAETLRSLDARGRIALEVEAEGGIILPLTEAAPLALVVSELVTNAVKYAFAGRDRGHLRLALRRQGSGARIEVADDGVGLPDGFDPRASGGLGMRIITSLVRQVGGTLSLDCDGGTRAAIDLPLRP